MELTASHGAGVRVLQKAEKKEAPAAAGASGRKAIAAPASASAENGEPEESGGSGVHALPSAGVVVEAEDETGTHLACGVRSMPHCDQRRVLQWI